MMELRPTYMIWWVCGLSQCLRVLGSRNVSDIEGPWPCPGVCWSHPNSDNMITAMLTRTLWENGCQKCVGCDYPYPLIESTCHDLKQECTTMLDRDFRTLVPTNVFNFSTDHFLDIMCTDEYLPCQNGYYHDQTDRSCLECIEHNFACPLGTHPKRCVSYSGGGLNANQYCDPCIYPVIQDTSKYVYGMGALFPVCTPENFQTTDCAWFLTPKWPYGYCAVVCNSGYISEGGVSGGFPDCRLCETTCEPGKKPPNCLSTGLVAGVGVGSHMGRCQPCGNTPPSSALWTHSCEWECEVNYFRTNSTDGNGTCDKCSVLRNCSDNDNTFFMGCGGNHEGRCIFCDISCAPGFYLNTSVFLDVCSCAPCSMPRLGSTFVKSNCSLTKDTTFASCGENYMKLLPGQYISRNCTAFEDIIISNCSIPLRAGLFLSRKCSRFTDALFLECPSGKSCNGTEIVSECLYGMTAQGGECFCGPLTLYSPSSKTCNVVPCPNGMFPDPTIGACNNCTPTGDQLLQADMQLPLPNVLGAGACRCADGYFKQDVITSNVSGMSYVNCWPCGDLNCLSGIQRQMGCDPDRVSEPKCVCGYPPGAFGAESLDRICNFECTSSYDRSNIEFDAIFDNFSYIPKSHLGPLLFRPFINNTYLEFISDSILLDVDNLLVLNSTGCLLLVDLMNLELQPLHIDINGFIPKGNLRQTFGPVSSMLSHGTSTDMVWISFSYWGLCDLNSEESRLCSAIELLYFQRAVSAGSDNYCVGLFCIRLGTQIWGKDFSTLGVSGVIQDMVFDYVKPSYLYIASIKDMTLFLYSYEVKFYNEGDLREDDYPLRTIVSYSNVKSVSKIGSGISGIYISMMFSMSDVFVMYHYSLVMGKWYSLTEMFLLIHGNTSSQWARSDVFTCTVKGHMCGFVMLSSTLILFQGTRHILDLANFFVSEEYVLAVRAHYTYAAHTNQLAVIGRDGIWEYNNFSPCPSNQMVYEGVQPYNSECKKSLCYVNKDACGPNSFRDEVTGECKCERGFEFNFGLFSSYVGLMLLSYDLSGICTACPRNHYCIGGIEPKKLCPANSFTIDGIASSVDDCYCLPGYFHFAGKCILCPTNMWCPFNGTIVPISCKGLYSTTTFEGASSPLDCICNQRSHGISCIPCSDTSDCALLGYEVPKLYAVHVQGWAPFWGDELLNQCLVSIFEDDLSVFTFYVISTNDFMYLKKSSSDSAPLIFNNFIMWNWVIVLKGTITFNTFHTSFLSCMQPRGFLKKEINDINYFPAIPAQHLRVEKSCGGRYWEWSGDLTGIYPSCTCIAGYESVITLGWGQQCFPCINGTYRSRRFHGGCLPCTSSNEEAPFLGMSECLCKSGYTREPSGVDCIPIKDDKPFWYPTLHSPLIFISSTVSVCVAVLILFGFVAIRCI